MRQGAGFSGVEASKHRWSEVGSRPCIDAGNGEAGSALSLVSDCNMVASDARILEVGIVLGKPQPSASLRILDLARGELRRRFRGAAWGWVALCAILAISPLGGSAGAKEAVVWIESYDEALREARRTGKPIFLEFRCAP